MSIFSQKSNEFSPDEIKKIKEKPLLENILITVMHSITDIIPNAIENVNELTPCFNGSYDWHSCVHSFWTMIQVSKLLPGNNTYNDKINDILNKHITESNIEKEIKNLDIEGEYPYGFVWFLSLAAAIKSSKNFNQYYKILIPLENFIKKYFIDNLLENKNVKIIEEGEHYNTAFALILLFYYAKNINDGGLLELIKKKSIELYLNHTYFEKEIIQYSFLSNNLCILHLLSLVLTKEDFLKYISKTNWKIILKYKPFKFDISKPLECHEAGLNFSRSWNYNTLSYIIRNEEDNKKLLNLADEHHKLSKRIIPLGNWVYDHYLGTFCFMAEISKKTDNIFQ